MRASRALLVLLGAIALLVGLPAGAAHAASGERIVSFEADYAVNPDGSVDVTEHLTWQFGPQEPNPYQLEWDHLIEAIRKDKPYNEARRGAEASLITAMGRLAAHTGRLVTRDETLNHEHDLAPDVDKLTLDSPAPLLAGADGKYPIPQPGVKTRREF